MLFASLRLRRQHRSENEAGCPLAALSYLSALALFSVGHPAESVSVRSRVQPPQIRLERELAISDNDTEPFLDGVPIQIVRDRRGYFFIISASSKSVVAIDSVGRRARVIGGIGRGPKEYVNPSVLATSGDTLWIFGFKSVSLFTLDGRFLGRKATGLETPYSVAFWNHGFAVRKLDFDSGVRN
jgi:hypothetical protein